MAKSELLKSDPCASVYVDKNSGKRYAVLQECNLRRGNNWIEAVCYLRKGEMFVRAKHDFDVHFAKESD